LRPLAFSNLRLIQALQPGVSRISELAGCVTGVRFFFEEKQT